MLNTLAKMFKFLDLTKYPLLSIRLVGVSSNLELSGVKPKGAHSSLQFLSTKLVVGRGVSNGKD